MSAPRFTLTDAPYFGTGGKGRGIGGSLGGIGSGFGGGIGEGGNGTGGGGGTGDGGSGSGDGVGTGGTCWTRCADSGSACSDADRLPIPATTNAIAHRSLLWCFIAVDHQAPMF